MSSTCSDSDFIQIIPSNELGDEDLVRLQQFQSSFYSQFKRNPDFVVCSPGRINLIGDHIDYHGFAVLPMAIERSIWLGCCIDKENSGLTLVNKQSEFYPAHSSQYSFTQAKELTKSHQWFNYILCGYHGALAHKLLGVKPDNVFEHAHKTSVETLNHMDASRLKDLPKLNMFVDSNLPPASGLSSSSALVCGSAVATMLLINHDFPKSSPNINKSELADACSKFEHLIGTHGGGMDQAVIMTAQQDFAKFVEFVPKLKCENVRLPEGTVWLVSHSGVDYPKAATSGYNARVLETKLGAAVIAKCMNVPDIAIDKSITLSKIKTIVYKNLPAQKIVDHMRDHIFSNVRKFTIDQICALLDMSRSELIQKFDTTETFLKEELNDTLELLTRCEHVIEEAERVEKFKSICDTTTDIGLLGQLMTQSHYSLKDKFGCSHPALDRLVSISLDAGALGSRLTGAGWGGCTVSLVETSKCDTVFKRLSEVSKFIFRSEPQPGCRVIRLMNQKQGL